MLIKYSPGGQGCPGGYSFNPASGYTGTLTDGLVGWWSLDEESGTRADSVGSTDLSDTNTVGYDTGKNGNAAKFVAANTESLTLASPAEAMRREDSDFSLAFWMNLSTLGGQAAILGRSDGWDVDYGLWIGNVNGHLYVSRGTMTVNNVENTDIDYRHPSTVGVWYFVALTNTAATNTVSLSINNGTPATGELTGAVGNLPFRIGYNGLQNSLDGVIDEVGAWTRVLTADEITELYASGSGVFYPFT